MDAAIGKHVRRVAPGMAKSAGNIRRRIAQAVVSPSAPDGERPTTHPSTQRPERPLTALKLSLPPYYVNRGRVRSARD